MLLPSEHVALLRKCERLELQQSAERYGACAPMRDALRYLCQKGCFLYNHGALSYDPIPIQFLTSGAAMPMIALGTAFCPPWPANYSVRNLKLALTMGIRHVDLSDMYPGFSKMYAALSQFERTGLFVSLKLWMDRADREVACHADGSGCFRAVIRAFNDSMNALKLTYVDLLMLHHPPSDRNFTQRCVRARAQWTAIQHLHSLGIARSTGVSNYCASLMKCWRLLSCVSPMYGKRCIP